MRGGAAGDHDLADALAAQVLRRQRADFAGADHEHAASLSDGRNLPRQRDRGIAIETAPFAERRFAAHALADAERPLEQLAEHWAGAVPLARRPETRP